MEHIFKSTKHSLPPKKKKLEKNKKIKKINKLVPTFCG
jgi:hypothetical protein